MSSKKPVKWGELTFKNHNQNDPSEGDAHFITKEREVFLLVFSNQKWEYYHVEKLPKFGENVFIPV